MSIEVLPSLTPSPDGGIMPPYRLERLTVSVPEAALMLGLGKKSMYALVKRSDFPKIKLTKKTLIPLDGLSDWLAEHTVREGAGGDE